VDDDRFPLAAVLVALVLLGAALGIWGTFLVPTRLPGGVEGLSVVLGLAGNAGAGVFGWWGTRTLIASVLPGIGWLVGFLMTQSWLPGGDVILAGRLPNDPGVVVVGYLFMLAGVLGTALAVVLAQRFTRRDLQPTQIG
jgi:hypothetical protein